jgi:hypothetical protein
MCYKYIENMNTNSYNYAFLLRRALFLVILLTVTVSTNANAFFFFFLPGSVTSKIGDVLTGSEGDNCVSDTAKVGDTLTSNTGNTAIIKSLSGTSNRCQDANHPIRALVRFNFSFTSKAGIELPEGFKPNELTSTQLFNGSLLSAHDASKKIGVSVLAQPRKKDGDGGVLARNISTALIAVVENGKISDEEELTINGLHAYRFRMVGKNKGLFGRSFTYVVTVLVGSDEFVQINANCLTDDFGKYKDLLDHFAYDIKGLNVVQPIANISIPVTQTSPELPVVALPEPASVAPPSNALMIQSESSVSKLRALKVLYKDGLINQKEFEWKKKEILDSM